MPSIHDLIDQTEYFIPNLTVHKLRSYKSCARSYLLNNILRLRPAARGINMKIAVGSAYAAGLEVYRTTEGDLPAAQLTAIKRFLAETNSIDFNRLYNTALLVEMLDKYDQSFPYWADYRPFMYPNGELAIENEFQTTLELSFRGHELIYTTKPDAIYITPENTIVVVDDKSGYSVAREGQDEAYEVDMQMCMYLYCTSQNGVPAEAIEIRYNRYTAADTHVYSSFIPIAPDMVEQAVDCVNLQAERLVQESTWSLWQRPALDYQCLGCPYLGICKSGTGHYDADAFVVQPPRES